MEPCAGVTALGPEVHPEAQTARFGKCLMVGLLQCLSRSVGRLDVAVIERLEQNLGWIRVSYPGNSRWMSVSDRML